MGEKGGGNRGRYHTETNAIKEDEKKNLVQVRMEREDAGGRAIYPYGEEQQHHSCSEACGEDTA